ncbi:MAG: hypothetical protein D6800_06705 [Candidatus Zixiibacteriota bacterium]|nr:MAG: hypothetical protein D6800_06705 [candidate division Zixibacteria bacterium]
MDEHVERVANMIRRISENFPTGIERFDRIWVMLRVDRPHVEPVDCLQTRLLVQYFWEQLEEKLSI